MLWRIVLWLALPCCLIALISIPVWLRSNTQIEQSKLAGTKLALLWIGGILFGFVSLVGLAAAAWGMDTQLPWGVGVYPYLLLVLGLPAFSLLFFARTRILSLVLWVITITFPFAWYWSERAERTSKGWAPNSDPRELLGTFLNAFTLVMIPAAIFVHLAASCEKKILTLPSSSPVTEHQDFG